MKRNKGSVIIWRIYVVELLNPGKSTTSGGGLAKLDSSGNVKKEDGHIIQCVNRSKHHTGGKYVRIRKFKSYDVGMQVPHRMDTEIQEEKAVCKNTKGAGRRNQTAGRMQGKPDTGRTHDERPYICADDDTAEIFGVARRYIQNQETEDKKLDSDMGLFPELS